MSLKVNPINLFFIDRCQNLVCKKTLEVCIQQANKQAVCICPVCNEEYDLICGKDGLTYASKCYFKRQACLDDRKAHIALLNGCGKYLLEMLD